MWQLEVLFVEILLAIKGCEAHRDRWQAQLATWAVHGYPGVQIHYFTGKELSVSDDYVSLPAKTKAICNYAKAGPFKFAFLTDTDDYVCVPRLLASDFAKWDYSGYKLEGYTPHPYCSGPHYWLSRKAFEILAEADWSEYPLSKEFDTCEDCKVGEILFHHGIFPHHDPRYAPFDAVLPNNDRISQHLSSRGCFRIPMIYEAHWDLYGTNATPSEKDWVLQNGENTLRLEYPLTSESVVFDVGGYKGDFTADLLRKGQDPYVHIFEPVERFSRFCQQRFANNPKVTVHNFALGAKTEEKMMSVDEERSGFYVESEWFEAVRIKDVCEVLEGFKEVDLFSVNIEGAEYVLFYRLLDTPTVSKFKNIQIQIHDFVDEADTLRNTIRQLLANTHSERYNYPFTWESWRRK